MKKRQQKKPVLNEYDDLKGSNLPKELRVKPKPFKNVPENHFTIDKNTENNLLKEYYKKQSDILVA